MISKEKLCDDGLKGSLSQPFYDNHIQTGHVCMKKYTGKAVISLQ